MLLSIYLRFTTLTRISDESIDPISIQGIYDNNFKPIYRFYPKDNNKIEYKGTGSNEYEWSGRGRLTEINNKIITPYNNHIIDDNTRDNTNSFDSDSDDSVIITKDQQLNDLKRDRIIFEENNESSYTEISNKVQPLVKLKSFVTIKDLIKRRSDYFSRLELAFDESTWYDCTMIESIMPSEEESIVIHLFES
mmetsp:Transcript_19138/g.17357  ORF Transcript_19138/g.17357 Transcript_19138/m.17357 type:complete len:193 (+) Transcript_19138:54-632(+)